MAFVSQKPIGCPCKKYGGMEVYLHVFLTSVLHRGEQSASRLDHFTSLEERTPADLFVV
jgi:hypothetical protein